MPDPMHTPLLTHQPRCQPSVRAHPCLGILCAGTITTKPSCPRQWGCRASMRKCCIETTTGQSLCSPLPVPGGSQTYRRLEYPSMSPLLVADMCPRRREPMKMCNLMLHVFTHIYRSPRDVPKLLTGFSVVHINMQDVPYNEVVGSSFQSHWYCLVFANKKCSSCNFYEMCAVFNFSYHAIHFNFTCGLPFS